MHIYAQYGRDMQRNLSNTPSKYARFYFIKMPVQYSLVYKSRYFRDLKNGTIITKGKAQSEYLPFQRSVIYAIIISLVTACAALVIANTGQAS